MPRKNLVRTTSKGEKKKKVPRTSGTMEFAQSKRNESHGTKQAENSAHLVISPGIREYRCNITTQATTATGGNRALCLVHFDSFKAVRALVMPCLSRQYSHRESGRNERETSSSALIRICYVCSLHHCKTYGTMRFYRKRDT